MRVRRLVMGGALAVAGACTPAGSGGDVDARLLEDWSGAAMLAGQGRMPCDSVVIGTPVAHCGATRTIPSASLSAYIAAAAEAAQRGEPSPAELQRLTRLDLVVNATDARTLTRVLASLSNAIRPADAPVELLIDHSAVALQRFAVLGQARDLVAALESATRALERDPSRVEAAYNRALGLTWAGMRGVTRRAWATHRALSKRGAGPVLVDRAAVGDDDALALTGNWHEATREHAWNVALPRFGAALRRGLPDSIRVARVTLDSLVTLSRRDDLDQDIGTLRDTLQAAYAAHDSVRVRAVSVAIERYLWAHSGAGRQNEAEGMRVIDSLLAQPSLPAALRRWVMMEHVNQLLIVGRSTEAIARFAVLEREAPAHTRIYRLRARSGSAMTYTSLGRSAEAVARMREVERECADAQLESCELSMAAMAAMSSTILGDLQITDAAATRTMHAMARAPRSMWHWSAAYLLHQIASLYGAPRVADAFTEEGLEVAVALDRADLAAESAQEQTDAALQRGDLVAAERYLREFRARWLPRQTVEGQEWSRIDVLRSMAVLARDTRPTASVAMLDTALQLTASDNNDARRTPIRIEWAMSLLAAGDTTRALAEMNALMQVLRDRGRGDTDVFNSARLARVLQRLTWSSAQALRAMGAHGRALQALSGQQFLRERVPSRAGNPTARAVAVRLIGDSAWVWTPSADSLRLTVVPLPERVVRAAATLDTVALQRVYTAVLASMMESTTVAAVCLDVRGPVSQVPWVAMRRRDGRFLVQDTRVSHVTDAQRGCDDASRLTAASLVTVVDAAPTKGPRALPASKREVTGLQQVWGASARVVDASRGGDATLRAMSTASVVHYAGHAVLDREQPDRSYLWLGADADSMITSADIATQRFVRSPVVILGACDSGTGSDNAFGGFDSLAGAFLSAGASAVIGAAWPVDDAPTGQVMQALHRALRAGATPAEALRQAQVMALQSSDPSLRTPRVWAAFHLSYRQRTGS